MRATGQWLTGKPGVELYTGKGILPALLEAITSATSEVLGLCYTLDHPEICGELQNLGVRGVKLRILFDKGQFMHSACMRQPARCRLLFGSTAEMKYIRPPTGGFSSMHCKVWVVDRLLLITGSANPTEYGMTRNIENIIRVIDTDVVSQMVEYFEENWAQGEVITSEIVKAAAPARRDKTESGQAGLQRSKSCGPERKTNRSLNDEFAAEVTAEF